MCLPYRQRDPKSRRIYSAGLFCLVFGCALTCFDGGFGHHHRVIFDGLRFLLLGMAIGLLLWSARRGNSCASGPERNS